MLAMVPLTIHVSRHLLHRRPHPLRAVRRLAVHDLRRRLLLVPEDDGPDVRRDARQAALLADVRRLQPDLRADAPDRRRRACRGASPTTRSSSRAGTCSSRSRASCSGSRRWSSSTTWSRSWRGGARAEANPWRSLTLEWQVSSPPPIFNFDARADRRRRPVRVRRPRRGARDLPARGGGADQPSREPCRPVSPRPAAGRRVDGQHPRPRQRDDRRRRAARRGARARTREGDARFHVVVPQTPAAPRQRDLRRGGARLRAGARRPRARVHARRGHRGHRRGRRRRPVQRRDGRDRRATASTRSSSRRCRPRSRAGCGAT